MSTTMTETRSYPAVPSREAAPPKEFRLANGLGWFSVGLGLAELAMPSMVARWIGVRDEPRTRTLLRTYGARELGAGIGILMLARPTGWVWARVAGDAVDLATLGSALSSRRTNKTRAASATAAVAGVTALDVVCAARMTASENGAAAREAGRVVKSIIVDCSPKQAYRFWHDFQNLPRFMTYLESVTTTGDRRSHWVAKGPAGTRIEWDAETVVDDPNRTIAWRTSNGARFEHSGAVHFQDAPGNRGTMVRVDWDFAPAGQPVPSVVKKLFGADLGRRIVHDLRNFKQMVEVGEVTQSDSSIHSGMYPAQPSDGR